MVQLKVILGLLELAAAFKFFSNTDLVWEWGVIDRDFVLAVWIILSCDWSTVSVRCCINIHHAHVEKTGGTGFAAAFLFAYAGNLSAKRIGRSSLSILGWIHICPRFYKHFQKTGQVFAASNRKLQEKHWSPFFTMAE